MLLVMKSNTKNIAPKFPRFNAPKSMISKVFIDKKTKSKSRQAQKRNWVDEANDLGYYM